MDFLEDDKEYILAIKEVSAWGSIYFSRKLFVIMLFPGTINIPCHVLNNTWSWFSDGILNS